MNARRGQSVFEYSALIAAISLAVVAMAVYAQRAVRANMTNVEAELTAELPAQTAGAGGDEVEDIGFDQRPEPIRPPYLREPFGFVDGE